MMEPIIVGSRGAILIHGIGWCWYYDNYSDNHSFDYCMVKCNEQESIMLTKIDSNRVNGVLSGT